MGDNPGRLVGPARTLTPGVYAVSASLVRGLRWRFYDSLSLTVPQSAWQAAWSSDPNAFAYFAAFKPVAKVGHSIFVYEIRPEDVASWSADRTRPGLKE